MACAWLILLAAPQAAAEEAPRFFRAFNLNGPALTIDGHAWEAGDAPGLDCDGLSAFEDPSVELFPAVEPNLARMIRSSRWSPEGRARVRVSGLPPGVYSVYVYLWEDNHPQKFDLRLSGRLVAAGVDSGPAGSWARLGPWTVEASDGTIELAADGGHANLSGLELWRGKVRVAPPPPRVSSITTDRRAGTDWWSLQPVGPVEPPPGPGHPIDRFIQERLARAGLKPAPEADRRTLIRRLSFDLLGLPPEPEEIDAFVADPDPGAYERLVDRLLDSPHYGERWARHWLDLVRFGESQGFERNKLRPNAWKYRDFVVEAFNADLPYDEFIRWQIAGDVIRPEDPLAVAASGFLAMGPYDLTAYNNGTPPMRAFAREEELEGLVGTVTQTFLGLTVNCARCHDHKFDPIRQEEFYQISAALGGTYQGKEREVPAAADRKAAIDARIAELAEATGREAAAQRARLLSVARLLEGGPVHTTVPSQPGTWRVLERGDYRKPGRAVTARGLDAVAGVPPDWGLSQEAPEAERRRALADWIAHPDHPLTRRVIVNRLWGLHFGAGLVPTPSDFGFLGGRPSHPELLDWLAGRLEPPAWSLKKIQRLIVTSAAYRQSSRADPRAMAIDADNRLLWRRPPQRLEAEAFRDAALAVSGELDRSIGGPGWRDFKVSSAGDNETYAVFDAVGGEFNRRSLYRTWVRAGTHPLMDLFDCPDPSVATPRRAVTHTPLQALALLNDAFINHVAVKFAERLGREAPDGAAAQIRRAYALALGRPPAAEEEAVGVRFVREHGLAQFCVVLLNLNEFLFID
jgi:hypothetical protein